MGRIDAQTKVFTYVIEGAGTTLAVTLGVKCGAWRVVGELNDVLRPIC